MLKLNLGSGSFPIDGWENLDRKTGDEIFPLRKFDGQAAEIRASHVLEHFSHRQVSAVLADWVRVLAPGGWLKIAVPDFGMMAQAYVDGEQLLFQGYVMGGQVDLDDYHKSIFDFDSLTQELKAAGLVDIRPWKSEVRDCANLRISLNLEGRKPNVSQQPNKSANNIHTQVIERASKIGAAMSMPRLAFTDNYFSAINGLMPLGIHLRKQTGAFWGQCLEKCIDLWLDEGVEWILAMDYDTVFTPSDVHELIMLSIDHPEADAIAPIQAHRTKPTPLMTIRGEDGRNVEQVALSDLDSPLLKISTAHFGLTLINADKIRQMPRPLFLSVPGDAGKWDSGRQDEDIYFWRRWEEAGNSLYLANRVPVGHAELMIRWPNRQIQAQHQHTKEFWEKHGGVKPPWVWV